MYPTQQVPGTPHVTAICSPPWKRLACPRTPAQGGMTLRPQAASQEGLDKHSRGGAALGTKAGKKWSPQSPPNSPPQYLCQGQPEHSHLPGEVAHLKRAKPGSLIWDREGKFTLSGKPSLLHRLAGTSQRPFVYLSSVLPPSQVRWESHAPGTEGSQQVT